MELTPEIRQRLKALMESKRDTGYTLNRKLGISATTIGNYLNGKITKADNTKIKAMCDLWGVDMEWLETGLDIVQHPKETEPENESPEEMLRQILIKLNGKDAQYSNIRKDILFIRDEINSIRKELINIRQQMQNSQADSEQ